MRLLTKLRAYAQTLPRANRNRTDLVRHLLRRPALLGAVATYETATFLSSRTDSRLKALASLRASSLIGCLF
jgi:alkylhydroperoxidase family enzyme